MTVLAIVNPNGLLGSELRQALRQRRELWDEVRLLTTEHAADDEATLSEVDGDPVLVQELTADRLEGVDLLLVCGDWSPADPPWQLAPQTATTILVSPRTTPEEGLVIVSGVNLDAAEPGALLVSPHPAVVLLALMLVPLREFGLQEVVAWLVQPATMREQGGMDELMDQTRSLLAFRDEAPNEVFGHQLAFNLLPTEDLADPLVEQLQLLLGEPVPAALQIVQGGVFHSFAVSLFVRCRQDPGATALAAALDGPPQLRRVAAPLHLGPIEAAASDEVLLGAVTAARHRPGGYWLWGVMDNLTRGGATNALEIAAAVAGPGAA